MLVELAVKLVAGRRFVQTSTHGIEIVMAGSLPGQSPALTARMDRELVGTVLRSDNSGSLVEVSLRKIRATQTVQNATDSYESEWNDPRSTPLARSLSSFINAPFRLEFNRAGKVEKATGYDAIWAANSGAREKNVFASYYSDAQLKKTYNLVLAFLPNKPVAIGDRWGSRFHDNVLGREIEIFSDCALAAINDHKGHKLAHIEFGSDGGVRAGASPAKMTVEIADMRGAIEFDLAESWFASVRIIQRLDMKKELKQADGAAAAPHASSELATTASFRWLS